jgi:membrane protease YdiL (CAAX protease family)
MKIKKLDELQLIKRGNIFKHCLYTIIGLLIIYSLLLENGVVLTSHRNALVLIILFIVSMFCVEMIYHDIYPLSEKRQGVLYLFAGLAGLFVMIISARGLISGETRFTENEMLSDTGAGVIMGCLFLMIFLAYLVRIIFNKMRGEITQ